VNKECPKSVPRLGCATALTPSLSPCSIAAPLPRTPHSTTATPRLLWLSKGPPQRRHEKVSRAPDSTQYRRAARPHAVQVLCSTPRGTGTATRQGRGQRRGCTGPLSCRASLSAPLLPPLLPRLSCRASLAAPLWTIGLIAPCGLALRSHALSRLSYSHPSSLEASAPRSLLRYSHSILLHTLSRVLSSLLSVPISSRSTFYPGSTPFPNEFKPTPSSRYLLLAHTLPLQLSLTHPLSLTLFLSPCLSLSPPRSLHPSMPSSQSRTCNVTPQTTDRWAGRAGRALNDDGLRRVRRNLRGSSSSSSSSSARRAVSAA
jgi:hypothetical protein